MRVAVISDTHVGTLSELPERLLQALVGVDLIVHAGDFTQRAVLEDLRKLADVKAVCGNMDSRELKEVLPRKDVFLLNGRRIGLTHGSGPPFGMERLIRRMFTDVDLIIFGHSHKPCDRYIGECLMFNPGRAKDSFGLLTIGDQITAEIVRV